MSASILPGSRPQQTRDETLALLAAHQVADRVAILGCRGYFRDSMGAPGRNDAGLYDDAIVVVSPDAHVAFNANVDPSRGAAGMATLRAGVWRYKPGTHGLNKPAAKQYPALVQAAEVDVSRQGTTGYAAGRQDPRYGLALGGGIWRGYFGINLHRGGWSTTSSLGCQTIHPDQWNRFLDLVIGEMHQHGQRTLPYLLLEHQG